MGHFAISIPIGGAVPNFGMDPQIMAVDEAYQVSFRLIKVWPRLQPPNQFWVDVVVQNIITFFFTSGQKIMFSKFCSAQSKDHLRQFWEELDRFSRRSNEKTVVHLLQYGGQTLFWKMTNETFSESA